METYAEITATDAAERNRRSLAFRRERANTDVANAKKRVNTLSSALTLVEAQIANVEQMAKLAFDVPDDITTRHGFVASEILRECLADTHSALQQRADKAHKELIELKTVKIPRLKKQAESLA